MASVKYTDEQKVKALELLETQDIWAACQAVGANHTTIYRWHAAHVRTLLKEDPELAADEEAEGKVLRSRLQRRLLLIAMAHADRSDAARDGTQALRYMTAAAIALDKYRMELGEATSRTISEGADDIDRSVKQLVAEMDRRAADA